MKLELLPQVGVRQIIEDPIGKVYNVIDYWESQPKLEANLQVGNRSHNVKYVFAPPALLNYLSKGERYGAYLGDMMFVNSRFLKEDSDYLPYVLLKLHGEKYVNPGLDKTGKAKHWQSLWSTIRVAGQLMNSDRLYQFLKELENHESTNFFELDGQVKDFMNRYEKDLPRGKRDYLERHHKNKWVLMGRNEEALSSLGFDSPGFRNHAEAIMSSIKDLDLRNLYLVTGFVHTLASVEPNEQIQLERPYNSFAYSLTKEGNGFTDLVKFVKTQKTTDFDTIIKLPGKIPTWTALSKRLSYTMHDAEKRVKELAEKERLRLDSLIIEAGQKTSQFEKEIELVRGLVVSKNRFEEARIRLQSLPVYQVEVARLEELSANIAGKMQQLAELSNILVQQI